VQRVKFLRYGAARGDYQRVVGVLSPAPAARLDTRRAGAQR
jgi:hypothetical protein